MTLEEEQAKTSRAMLRAIVERELEDFLAHHERFVAAHRIARLSLRDMLAVFGDRLKRLAPILAEITIPPGSAPPSIWCAPCRSHHPDPTSYEHWQALKCHRPWAEWSTPSPQ